MKRNALVFVIMLLCCSLGLAACGNASPAPQTSPASTEVPADPSSTTNPTQTAAQPDPTDAPAASTDSPAPSPTPAAPISCTLAFDTNRDGNWEVYSMAADGSNLVNLSNNPADDFNPAWSPDGSQIAFVSNRENEVPGQYIYVMNADGSEVRQLTFEDGGEFPDWSHDGSALTYTSSGDIYVIKADGSGESINLTNSPELDRQSSWSPDGRLLLFASDKDGNNPNLFVMNPDGSNVFQVTNNGEGWEARWTIDGRIYTGWGWQDKEQNCNNCVVNPDGSDIREAGGKGMLRRYFPFWTVDDERVECASIAFDNAPTADIYLIGDVFVDGLYNLTNSEADERNVDWPANCGKDPLVIGFAGDDPSTQARLSSFNRACDELALLCPSGSIADLIAQSVDAIVLNSLNGVPSEDTAAIQSALDADIAVFLLDAELDLPGVYSVTIDQSKWVRTALEWMFEKIGGEGEFVYFDVFPAYHHGETIEQMLTEYPGITVVGQGGGEDFDPFWVKPQTSDYWISNPEIKAVWTNAFWQGAIQGIEESGAILDKWPLLVCEASSNGMAYWNEILQRDPNFDCIAVGNPSGIAYDAFYAAYYLLNGAQIDPAVLSGRYGRSLFVDFPVATSENRQEIMDNNSNLDQFMSPEEIIDKWFLD